MKKTCLSLLALSTAICVSAQSWTPANTERKKFLEIVKEHEEHEEEEREAKGKRTPSSFEVVEEDEEYQFDRWKWYWKQHLDADGYIVKSWQTAKAWQDYEKQARPAGTAAKATATDNWSFVGPNKTSSGYNGMGRINVVAFDPVDSNTFYVGSATGSTWKTTNGGTTWAPLYDNIVSMSVADIKVNPRNGKTIYVSTGDPNQGFDKSIGVLKSYNGGVSWTNIGPSSWTLDSFVETGSIVINPVDTSHLTLASSQGIFKSANSGATWQRTFPVQFKQLLYCPSDTTVMYGTTNEGGSAQIRRSADGGFTWALVTSFTDAQRINIAVCPAAPGVVMAIVSQQGTSGLKGIYKSTDYGISFSPVFLNDASCGGNLIGGDNSLPTTSCNAHGWYDLCIAIDPLNQNNVTIGGINNYYSSDGGVSWDIANQWWNEEWGLQVVHADKHWLGYNALTHALFLGCDGGVYKTYAPLANGWKDLSNGLCITQFYRNAVNNDVSFCIGGAQDNGTKLVDGTTTVTNLTGGDGMQCLISYNDPSNIWYTATQNGYVNVTFNAGASYSSITDDLPTPGAWITPYVQHPQNPATLYIGYEGVYKTTDGGVNWTAISPNFSGNNIQFLAVAMSNPDYIFAVRDAGSASRVHYTTNGGTSWLSVTPPFAGYVSDIAVDPKNEKKFWVTVSGYLPTAKVYSFDLTTNAWTNESTGLPNLPIDCIVVDSFSGTKYVGTDVTVFYKTPMMTSWQPYNTNLPMVHIYDLNINHTTSELWAATYGRGMWKSAKADVTPVVGIKQLSTWASRLSIAPNPGKGTFVIQAPGTGYRNTTVTVRFVSADGRAAFSQQATVLTNGTIPVETGALIPGVYVCEVVSKSEGVGRVKVVVE